MLYHGTDLANALSIVQGGTLNTPIERYHYTDEPQGTTNEYPGLFFSYGEPSRSGSNGRREMPVIFVMEWSVACLYSNFHMNRAIACGHISPATLMSHDAKKFGPALAGISEDVPEVVFHDGVSLDSISGIVMPSSMQGLFVNSKYRDLICSDISEVKHLSHTPEISTREAFLFQDPFDAENVYLYRNDNIESTVYMQYMDYEDRSKPPYAYDVVPLDTFNMMFSARFSVPYDRRRFAYDNFAI